MDRDDLREPDVSRMDRGYTAQSELLEDLSTWLDLLLYCYYIRHQWLGPSSELKNMLGLVVSREEFEHNLTKAALRGLRSQMTAEERERADLVRQAISLRIARTDAPLPLLQMFRRCGLDDFQQSCILLSYIGTVDRKYEKLLAYLQDDMTSRAPGISLAVQLFLVRRETKDGRCVEILRK